MVFFKIQEMHVTLRRRLRDLAPGLTPRSALEKFGSLQIIDLHLPTTDGRKIIMSRYTQPDPELQMLLKQLRLSLPNQPRPRVTADAQVCQDRSFSEDFWHPGLEITGFFIKIYAESANTKSG